MVDVLVKMDMHNVFRKCDDTAQTEPRNAAATVDRGMVPLIAELSKRRPAWQFISSGLSGAPANGGYRYCKFAVHEDGEELGWINKVYSYRTQEYTFQFDSPRLRAKRRRGAASETKDLKKAVKLICENFSALTLSERLAKARNKIDQQVPSVLFRHTQMYKGAREQLIEPIMDFVFANWERFVAATPANSTVQQMIAALPERAARSGEATAIAAHKISNTGFLVLEYNNKFYVQQDGTGEDTTALTHDGLSTYMKGAIAMLKLVPVETTVAGVGVQIEQGLYYVIPESKNE